MVPYQIFRLIASVILAAIFFLCLRKKLKKNFLYIGAAVILIGSNIIFCAIPFENKVISFATPDEAAHYVGFPQVSHVVEGEASGLFLSGENGKYEYRIFPKAENGWQLGGEGSSRTHNIVSNGVINILIRYGKTQEFYLLVIYPGPATTVEDTAETHFELLEAGDGVTADTLYLAYIPHFSDGYVVTVNGENISLSWEDSGFFF